MTTEQKLARMLDALSFILENAKCVSTRRFVAKVLRELEDGSTSTPAMGFNPSPRPREHLPSLEEYSRALEGG